MGISETPGVLQKQTEKALEYTRKKWRVTANTKTCAVVVVIVVVVCNEDKGDAVNFKWKWREDELPIVDQYTYRRDLKGLLLGCTHSESNRKG